MPRPQKQPSYRRHRARNCAVVTIDGHDHYLGPYDSPESHARYAELISDWRCSQSNGAGHRADAVALPEPSGNGLTISELMLRFWFHAEKYYRKPNGQPTSELSCIREALRRLRGLHGSTIAGAFGPKQLKAVRQLMIDQELSRKTINNHIGRIKRMFKWGVAEELVPATVFHSLQAVCGLRWGRSEAQETEPVKPVPDAWVDAVLPFVSPQIRAMIELQRLTGMRPCEVTLLRACDIDTTGEIWIFEPQEHKNQWRGHRRLIPLGPQAQKIIGQFFKLETSAYLFSPADAEVWRNAIRRQNRKTQMTPSQAMRKAKPSPKYPKRDRYDTDSYRGAIEYGIKKAKKAGIEIPHWFPLQLRHSRATEVRKRFGLEGAQVALGHAHAAVTEVYAEKNLDLAIQIARETG